MGFVRGLSLLAGIGSAPHQVGGIQRGTHRLGQGYGVVNGPVMQVKQPRVVRQRVVVQFDDRDVARAQGKARGRQFLRVGQATSLATSFPRRR